MVLDTKGLNTRAVCLMKAVRNQLREHHATRRAVLLCIEPDVEGTAHPD